jgi:hypothetical protein
MSTTTGSNRIDYIFTTSICLVFAISIHAVLAVVLLDRDKPTPLRNGQAGIDREKEFIDAAMPLEYGYNIILALHDTAMGWFRCILGYLVELAGYPSVFE